MVLQVIAFQDLEASNKPRNLGQNDISPNLENARNGYDNEMQ